MTKCNVAAEILINFRDKSLGRQYRVMTASEGCGTEMVKYILQQQTWLSDRNELFQ